MTRAVSPAEAKLFLRVTQDAEDGLIGTLIDAGQARLERELGVTLSEASPAPLRLAVLQLAAAAYESRGEGEPALGLVEPWVRPFRTVRL